MTARKQSITSDPINPDYFYRLAEASRYFGYGLTALCKKIELGEIPEPVALTDSGHARGFFGHVILKWQQERKTTSTKMQATAAKVKATKAKKAKA